MVPMFEADTGIDAEVIDVQQDRRHDQGQGEQDRRARAHPGILTDRAVEPVAALC